MTSQGAVCMRGWWWITLNGFIWKLFWKYPEGGFTSKIILTRLFEGALEHAHIARRFQRKEEISRNIVAVPEGAAGFRVELDIIFLLHGK